MSERARCVATLVLLHRRVLQAPGRNPLNCDDVYILQSASDCVFSFTSSVIIFAISLIPFAPMAMKTVVILRPITDARTAGMHARLM